MGEDALRRRFPALGALPRAALGRFPTPVRHLGRLGGALWIKREDLNGRPLGGNKVRSLEFLLGAVRPGDTVLTVGAAGSTHALATALHARALGARTIVVRWPQGMNATAERVARRLEREATCIDARTAAGGLLRALAMRLGDRRLRWVPAGGSSPLGTIGHVGAALELAEQVARGEMPAPARIVLPLGSGGTSAGILLGLAIAGVDAEVVAVRVAPRIAANAWRVRALARRTARLLERLTGERVRLPARRSLRIVHGEYGAGYGHETRRGREAARALMDAYGTATDQTYGAKALAAALDRAGRDGGRSGAGATLLWLTFDAWWMREAEGGDR